MNRKEVEAAVNKICDTPLKTPLFDIANEVGVLQNLADVNYWVERRKEEMEREKNPKQVKLNLPNDRDIKKLKEEVSQIPRKIMKLYFTGYTKSDIASIMGSSLKAISSIIDREMNKAKKATEALSKHMDKMMFDHIGGELEDECPVCYNGKSHCTCVLGDLRKAKEEREENER
jgi:hypothetical protein